MSDQRRRLGYYLGLVVAIILLYTLLPLSSFIPCSIAGG